MKKNIREIDLEKIIDQYNEPLYRVRQLYRWLWKKSIKSFEEISNLPESFKTKLKKDFYISQTSIKKKIVSVDGTIKFLFELSDGLICEGVLIPQKDRFTACISSQVGCSLSCKFCATGKMKRARNILASEIFDQVFLIMEECKKTYAKELSNIVYMGMGEPFLNYQNVINSIKHITNKEGLYFSRKRITLSTVGIVKMIRKFALEKTGVNLAVSLHAACNEKRNEIMDINKTNNLDLLEKALKYYYSKTKNRVTYEYVMLHEINDSTEDVSKLIEFCKIIPSKVNLIEFNLVEGAPFTKASSKNTEKFMERLKKEGIIVNLRKSRGEDVSAACGQLAILTQI